jgi:hypothetical protein
MVWMMRRQGKAQTMFVARVSNPSSRPQKATARQAAAQICLAASIVLACFASRTHADDADKPKVAVFPLAGTASDAARDKVGFALRAKLNRDGTYDAIDGPTMSDIAGHPIPLSATADDLEKLSAEEKPAVLIWGVLDGQDILTLKLNVLDLRKTGAQPTAIEKTISEPTQLRFAVESALDTIAGVKEFEHPDEKGVSDDPTAAALWAKNPNLLPDGDFATQGHWSALFRSEKYQAPISESLPETDKVCIYRLPADTSGEKPRNVLAMRLSLDAAQSNGLACISDSFHIEPDTRYRIRFRYRSDGPTLHVFVKGYTAGKDLKGDPKEIENYRRQVPPSGSTDGKWVAVVSDLNPQNPDTPVQTLRVDLYAYANAGLVMFDDVEVKAVGEQTRQAKDDAPRPRTTQP